MIIKLHVFLIQSSHEQFQGEKSNITKTTKVIDSANITLYHCNQDQLPKFNNHKGFYKTIGNEFFVQGNTYPTCKIYQVPLKSTHYNEITTCLNWDQTFFKAEVLVAEKIACIT